MKKLLLITLLIGFCSLVSNAQTTMTQTDPAGASATVNTNADTSYHLAQLAGQTNNFNELTFVLKGTKTSGTVGGTATLWGSNDNSRWFAVYGSTPAVPDTLITSVTLANSDNDGIIIVDKTRFRYYRWRVITTGTQVSSYVCTVLGRKVPN